MEYDLVYGQQPRMEDDVKCKTTLDGGQPWMEDNIGWKTTLIGRQP